MMWVCAEVTMAKSNLNVKSTWISPSHQTQGQDDVIHLLHSASVCYDKSCQSNSKTSEVTNYRDEAKSLALQALAINPGCTDSRNLLSRIALDTGDLGSALQLITEALQLSPDNAGYYYTQGHIFLAQQEYEKAESAFSKAMKISAKGTRADTSFAYTKTKQGQFAEAFQYYRTLVKSEPKNPHIRSKLFECCSQLTADYYSYELEQDLMTYLNFSGVNHNLLSPLISSLINHKYHLTQSKNLDLYDIIHDEFLRLSLRKVFFTNTLIEQFISAIRREILVQCLTQSHIPEEFLPLSVAIAINSSINEYVYYIAEDEEYLIKALSDLIQIVTHQDNWGPDDISGAFIMWCLYRDPKDIPCIKAVESMSIDQWPEYIQPLIECTLMEDKIEKDLSHSIPSLQPITNTVSKSVKNQYEQSPYPRWVSLSFNTPTDYGQALQEELIQFKIPQFFLNAPSIKVLIAGCGTGRHALHVAKYFRNVEVLAFDISYRSLAYAKKMAKRYNILNIRFLQGDILDLVHLKEQFHIIECSGVLHHMDNPLDGWKSLKSLLLPHGLMKIALYSERARKEISACRSKIKELDVDDSLASIRSFRQRLLTEGIAGSLEKIQHSPDFYNMSGCRDLLFHVQEHQFNPILIEEYLNILNLKFLGFTGLSNEVKTDYISQHPTDLSLVNLNLWDKYEIQHPDLFAGMYQFYCQNPIGPIGIE